MGMRTYLIGLGILIPLSVIIFLLNVILSKISGHTGVPVSPWRYLFALLLPIFIVNRAIKKKNLDFTGAVIALFVGFIMTLSNLCFCAALFSFFFAGSKATRFRSHLKEKIEEDHEKGSRRNWIQVVCNGGVASFLSLLYILEAGLHEEAVDFSSRYTASWLSMAVLASLACAAGDTFASELGTVVGAGEPRLIVTMQVVPKGTNGGVSVMGSVMSILGGVTVGLAYYCTLCLALDAQVLHAAPPQWPIILIAGVCGFVGSMLDSVLGATLQFSGYDTEQRCVVAMPGPHVEHISGVQVLDNHSVNLITNALMAVIGPTIALPVWGALRTL